MTSDEIIAQFPIGAEVEFIDEGYPSGTPEVRRGDRGVVTGHLNVGSRTSIMVDWGRQVSGNGWPIKVLRTLSAAKKSAGGCSCSVPVIVRSYIGIGNGGEWVEVCRLCGRERG